jgi:hypothetical protein
VISALGGLVGPDRADAKDGQNLPPVGGQEFEHAGQDTTTTAPEQPGQDAAQLAAECLAAVTGIYLTGAPSAMQLHIAEPSRYLAKLEKRIATFLEADKPAKFRGEKLPEQRATYEKITDILDPDKLVEWLADVPHEVALPYTLTVQAARAKVKEAWPVYPDPSLGLHNFELAPDELLDVVQVMRTLDNPESLFDDLDARVLLPAQVDLIAAIYPDLYREICKLCYDATEPYVEIPGFVEKKKDLSALKEEQLRVLMKLPTDAPMVATPEAPQPAPQKPGRGSGDSVSKNSSRLQTPSEHTAERRIGNK